eukprot:11301423-Ditylum_brightwellii.AAC.1
MPNNPTMQTSLSSLSWLSDTLQKQHMPMRDTLGFTARTMFTIMHWAVSCDECLWQLGVLD